MYTLKLFHPLLGRIEYTLAASHRAGIRCLFACKTTCS